MFEANKRDGVQHKFDGIQWVESEKRWYAWYLRRVDFADAFKNGGIDGN